MTAPRHLVERVRFDLAVHSRALGLSVQDRLSAFQRERLASIVSECIDTVLDANEHLSIPRLALDLGDVALEHLEHDVESRLRRELMAALRRARSSATRERFAHDSREAPGHTAAARLIAYVLDGRLDWTLQGMAVDLDALLQAAMDDPATAPGTLARQLVMTRAGRRRLAQQFSRASRRRIAVALRELRNAPRTIMPDEWSEPEHRDEGGVDRHPLAQVRGARQELTPPDHRPLETGDGSADDAVSVRESLTTGEVPAAWLAHTSTRQLVALLSARRHGAGDATRSPSESMWGTQQPVFSAAAAERLAETLLRYVSADALLTLLRRRQPHWRAMVHATLRAARESSRRQDRETASRRMHGERARPAYVATSGTRAAMQRLLVASLMHPHGARADEAFAATAHLVHPSDGSLASTARVGSALSSPASPRTASPDDLPDERPSDRRDRSRELAGQRLRARRGRDPLFRLRRLLRYGVTDAGTLGDRVALLEHRLVDARRTRWHDWRALARTVARDAVMRARLLAWCSGTFATQLLTDADSEAEPAHAPDTPGVLARRAASGVVSVADVMALLEHGALPAAASRRALLRTSTWAWMRGVLQSPERDALMHAMRASAHATRIARTLERTLPSRHLERLMHVLAPELAGFATSYGRAVRLAAARAPNAERAAAQRAAWRAILRYVLVTPRPSMSARGVVAAIAEGVSPESLDGRRAHLELVRDTAWRLAATAPRYASLGDVTSDAIAALGSKGEAATDASREAATDASREAQNEASSASPSASVIEHNAPGDAATGASASAGISGATADATRPRPPSPHRDAIGRLSRRLRFGRESDAPDSARARPFEAAVRRERRQRPNAWSTLARGVVSDVLLRARLASEFSLGLTVAIVDAAVAHRSADAQRASDAQEERSSRERRRRTRLFCEHLAALLAADERATLDVHDQRAASTVDDHASRRAAERTEEPSASHATALGTSHVDGTSDTPRPARDDTAPLVTRAVPPLHSLRWWRRLVQEALLHAASDALGSSTSAAAPAAERGDALPAVSLTQATLRPMVRHALERAAEVRGLSVVELSAHLRARAWFRAARAAERADRAARRVVDRVDDRVSDRTTAHAPTSTTEPAIEHSVERELADTLAARAGDSRKATARRASSRPAPGAPPDEGATLHVDDAGLVILWPMFSHFFSQLQLTNKGAFVDAEAANRAVLLLRHLVTGESEAPEPLLSLDKLLCGVPWGTPVPRRIALSHEELELSTQLLTVVTQRWAPLANTSIAGLREAFLQREGRLVAHDDGWQLTVATRAYDMLLDRLPWNLSPVRLPWMPALLHVRWRP